MCLATCYGQVPQSDHHDDGYNPTNYYRTSMDGKKLHASGNSADDLTEMAKPQPEVCDVTQHLFASRSKERALCS